MFEATSSSMLKLCVWLPPDETDPEMVCVCDPELPVLVEDNVCECEDDPPVVSVVVVSALP